MNEIDEQFARAAYVIGDLLASSLCPKSGSWDEARLPYIWEHNALCWLIDNRPRIRLINAWTLMLLDDGYPAKPFTDAHGNPEDAGAYWNASMPRRPDSLDEPRP